MNYDIANNSRGIPLMPLIHVIIIVNSMFRFQLVTPSNCWTLRRIYNRLRMNAFDKGQKILMCKVWARSCLRQSNKQTNWGLFYFVKTVIGGGWVTKQCTTSVNWPYVLSPGFQERTFDSVGFSVLGYLNICFLSIYLGGGRLKGREGGRER